jgi:hypothetical protein
LISDPTDSSPKYWWVASSPPGAGLSPNPFWVTGYSESRYWLGQPLPWPMYTTRDAPCVASRTAGQVACGEYSSVTSGV